MVEAFADGFGLHVAGRFFEGDEDADGGVFAVGGVAEVADVAGFYVAAFDMDDDAFCFARIVVNKDLDAVDAFVRTFFARLLNGRRSRRELALLTPFLFSLDIISNFENTIPSLKFPKHKEQVKSYEVVNNHPTDARGVRVGQLFARVWTDREMG